MMLLINLKPVPSTSSFYDHTRRSYPIPVAPSPMGTPAATFMQPHPPTIGARTASGSALAEYNAMLRSDLSKLDGEIQKMDRKPK